jgi:hypothetical protein
MPSESLIKISAEGQIAHSNPRSAFGSGVQHPRGADDEQAQRHPLADEVRLLKGET